MAGEIAFDIFARDHASAVFKKVGDSVEKSGTRFSKYAKTASIAGAVVGAALIKFGISSVKAFEEADASQRKLEDAYKRFPALADVSIQSMRKQSKAIESKTKFDDDAVVAAQANLGMYKLTGTQVQKLTPLLVDYAARTGKDLPSASQDLGKALLGQGRALKGVGINFKDTKTLGGNFNELMSGLRTNVGGFATKEGATASGRAEILKNKFNDLQENVGSFLVPALDKLATAGLKVSAWMEKHPALAKAIVIGLVAVTAAFVALTVVMAVFTAIADANPFVLLALGVVAVVAAVVIAYNKFKTFRDIVNAIGGVIKVWADANIAIFKGVIGGIRMLVAAFLSLLLKPIMTIFGAILHAAVIAFGWIPGLRGPLHKAEAYFRDFRDNVNKLIDQIQGKKTFVLDAHVTQATKDAYYMYTHLPASRVFTSYFQTVTLPGGRRAGFASGTDFAPGGMALVGERGPEIVNLPRGSQVIPNNKIGSMGGGVYIAEVHVHGVQSTSELWKSLQMYAKRNGSIKLSGITA